MNTPDQPIRTTIDGVQYVCHVQAAIQSNASLIRLTSILSPTTVSLLSGAVKGFDRNEMTVESLGNIDFVTGLTMLFSQVTPDSANDIIVEGMKGISTPGYPDLSEKQAIDNHFRGRLLHMYKVFAWGLSCNYKDFLDVAKSVASLDKLTSLMVQIKNATKNTPDSQSDTSPTATPVSSDLSRSVIQ